MFLLLNVRTIRLYTEYFATGTSLIANSLVLYFVLTNANSALSSYKRMLIASCLIDYVMCFWSSFTVANSILEENALLILSDGPYFYLSENAQYYLPFWHLFLVGTGTSIVPFDFFYRYNLICKNRVLSKRALVAVLLICCIPSFLTASVFQVAFLQNSTQNATFLHYKRLIESQTWIGDYGVVRAYVGSDCTNHLFMLGILMGMLVISVVYLISFYFGYKIYKQLNSMHFVSNKTKRLQQKMTIVLVVKAVFPFCLASVPALVVILSMILKFNMPDLAMWLAILTTLIPVGGPVTTLLLLGNFKQRLTSGMKKMFYSETPMVHHTQ